MVWGAIEDLKMLGTGDQLWNGNTNRLGNPNREMFANSSLHFYSMLLQN